MSKITNGIYNEEAIFHKAFEVSYYLNKVLPESLKVAIERQLSELLV